MDVYTTSFCLPYRTSYHELANRSPSFDFPRDVAGAATATGINHNSRHSASNSQSQASQQQQPQVQNQSQAPRHQVNRSLSSYSRPASIPEDREDGGTNGQNALGESTSSSSTGGSRFGGNGSRFGEGSNSQSGSASNVVGGANNATSTGLTARRSTSSIASLGQHTAPTTASSSIAGDNISTAPSSHIGHGVGGAFSNLNTGMTSILPAHHNNKIPSNTGSTGINHNHNHNHNSSEQIFNANTEGIIAIQRAQAELAESMQRLCMEAMANFQCMVTCSPIDDGTKSSTIPSTSSQQGTQVRNTSTLPSYNFILSGRYPQVMGARGYILRSSPYNRKAIVKVPRSEVLSSPSRSNRKESISSSNHNDGNGIINNGSSSNNNNNESYSGGNNNEQVKPEMKKKLDEIAALTRAHLAIVGQVSSNIGFGLELERSVEIVITGNYESVEQARVRLLVSLDELAGLHSDVCEIDYKLHNIISGRKRCVIQTIQEETATNIYFPTPLTGIISTSRDPNSASSSSLLLSRQNMIFITGEFFGVQRAKDMLYQVSLHKSKMIISRDTAMLPRKLDYLLLLSQQYNNDHDHLHHQNDNDLHYHHHHNHNQQQIFEEQVLKIMFDNGTFINFPMIGSQASLISVYGDHRINIERTLRAVMRLATQFYVSQFWLLPMNFDVFSPPPTINPSQVPAILRLISATTGSEAVFKSNCFEFHGTENEVRNAVQLLLEFDIIKNFHHEIRFQIELGNEHRDFISGKKNGKLNKIMKTAGVKIKFETFNDYNFLIDIAGNNTGALHGLSLLQEELPAEISFHVPEIYHKRIIGVGGKNIQRIMKKYGVYVKFSNAEEFAALGGYHENEDNVIARTPSKNSAALDELKAAVMEMVIPKDKDYVIETVSIPRRYHRTLLGEKSIFIHDIEAKTNSIVRFPNKETAADIISIFGPESQVHIAAQMLLDHVPFEAEFRLPHSEQMSQLALAPEFIELQDKIKGDLNITILPWVDRSGAGDETIIRFLLNRSNQHFLSTARDMVEEFLLSQSVALYPASVRPRSDSFANSSFPFFNSKLLSSLGDSDGTNVSPQSNATPLPDNGQRPVLRPAVSSPDIKALFNGAQSHRPYNNAPSQSNSTTSANTTSQFTSQPIEPVYQAKPAGHGLPELHTPRFHTPHGASTSGHTPSYSISSTFMPSHPTRLSEEMVIPSSSTTTTMSNKRESDPVMEAKIKDMIRRGALGHHLNARAQSLDISQQTKTFGRHASPSTDSEAVSAALSQLRL